MEPQKKPGKAVKTQKTSEEQPSIINYWGQFLAVTIKGIADGISNWWQHGEIKASSDQTVHPVAKQDLSSRQDQTKEKPLKKRGLTSGAKILASFEAKAVISAPNAENLASLHSKEFVNTGASLATAGKFAGKEEKGKSEPIAERPAHDSKKSA